MIDLDLVRKAFPALETPWALFDNAGGSVPAGAVIRRVAEYMSTIQVQTGASYGLSVAAGEAIAAGRRTAARLVKADEGEVVLGPSSTALARRLAEALRPTWSEGDRVIVTDLDHETNVGPWRALEASGIEVVEWRMRPETAALHPEDLEPLLTDRTRLVAFTHCANVVGVVHDVPAITARIREAGALSCVDGVAYAPHRRVDVGALGCDFYLASLYKVFGPHVGMMYGRRDALLASRNVNHFFVPEDEVPYKHEPGGVTHELVAGLVGIEDYLGDVARSVDGEDDPFDAAFTAFEETERALAAPLLDLLEASPRVRILGGDVDRARRVPTVAFTTEGRHASEIPEALDEHHIATRWGHFYAHRAMTSLGLHDAGGITRISMLHYNTPAEVARLTDALKPLVS